MTTGEAAAFAQSREVVVSENRVVVPGTEHCPALACQALVTAVRQYSDAIRNDWEGDEALICTCFCVSERTIEREIKAGGLRSVAEVTRACSAGGGCRSCYPLIEDILESVNADLEVQRGSD